MALDLDGGDEVVGRDDGRLADGDGGHQDRDHERVVREGEEPVADDLREVERDQKIAGTHPPVRQPEERSGRENAHDDRQRDDDPDHRRRQVPALQPEGEEWQVDPMGQQGSRVQGPQASAGRLRLGHGGKLFP